MLSIQDYFKVFIALFAVINPVGAIPMFITMSHGQTVAERQAATRTTIRAVAIILVMALFMGEALLGFFNISIHSFRVGGGILVLLMSLSMLQARSDMRQTKQELVESVQRSDYAVVPLAMPLLVGPGAISTLILFAQRDDGLSHYGLIVLVIAVISLAVWAALKMAPAIADRLGQTGI